MEIDLFHFTLFNIFNIIFTSIIFKITVLWRNNFSFHLGVLEARFEQTTQSEHDEIEWSPEEDTAEMQDQEEKERSAEKWKNNMCAI